MVAREVITKANEAIELIKMLELLAEGSSKSATQGDVPWLGVKLILSQTKELFITPEGRRAWSGADDTMHLIKVLEQLTSMLGRDLVAQREVPWVGIKLTLKQTREMLESARERISNDAEAETAQQYAAPKSEPEKEWTIANEVEGEATAAGDASRSRGFFSAFSAQPQSTRVTTTTNRDRQ